MMHKRLKVLMGLLLSLSGCAGSAPLPAKALALNQSGAEAAAAGDLSTAEARLLLAIEYNPSFTEAWVNLGLVELKRGNLEQASKHFRRARDLNADLPTPHHGLGLTAERRGVRLEAEGYYRASLRVDPGFAPSRVNLARSLFARQQFDEARLEFLKLTQSTPGEVAGFIGLSETFSKLSREAEAESALAEAEERFPGAPDVALVRGRRALAKEQFDTAKAAFVRASESTDRFVVASALAHLGLVALAEGKRSVASEFAMRAKNQSAEDPVLKLLEAELAKQNPR
jgi:tetratricopeptide (TPR) repeat protein